MCFFFFLSLQNATEADGNFSVTHKNRKKKKKKNSE